MLYIIFEIKHLIHTLQLRNILINFLWVPSHCGIFWNDQVDSLAKTGAIDPQKVNMIPKCFLSYTEFKSKTK